MNNNIFLRAIAISLVSNNGKFSYSQTGEMYSKISSYQIKRWLDKNWNEQEELEKYITKLNIDWSKCWLMIDDTVIEKHFSKTNECVYRYIRTLILVERKNKRSLYEAKKYFQQKFIGVKRNGNKALRLLVITCFMNHPFLLCLVFRVQFIFLVIPFYFNLQIVRDGLFVNKLSISYNIILEGLRGSWIDTCLVFLSYPLIA